tara:strand:+ start:964 stop:1422 length:459 start_codon:yes stop_codon:yes gene_type:complete
MEKQIRELVQPKLIEMGYGLVRVFIRQAEEQNVQIMVERLDGRAITVNDCAIISRGVSELFDQKDPIPGSYTLEISSPGINRPLTTFDDFKTYAGFEVQLETQSNQEGKRSFQAILKGIKGTTVLLEACGEMLRIDFETIKNANLIISQEKC